MAEPATRSVLPAAVAIGLALGALAVGGTGGCDSPPREVGLAQCALPADCLSPAPCQQAAGATCAAGSCLYQPKACGTPPAPLCVGGDATYRTYASTGTCQPDGSCGYSFADTACAGCAANCLGSCLGFACSDLQAGCRTSGQCLPGTPPTCSYQAAPDAQACDDGNACTEGDACGGGLCGSTPIADGQPCAGQPGKCVQGACVECLADGECDDGNPCTRDTCAATHCAHDPLTGTSCSDGNACTTGDTCAGGTCLPGAAVPCAAQSQCHLAGTCEPTTGLCSHPAKGAGLACDDANSCTHTDACDGAGHCVGTQVIPASCPSDPLPCGAQRSCNGTAACAVSYGTGACNDGNLCTSGDHCDGAGSCVGTPVTCAAPATCRMPGVCNPGSGTCTYAVAVGTSCTNPNACITGSTCDAAANCTGGTNHPCSGGGICQSVTCNGAGGCTTTNLDGEPCGCNGTCSGGACVGAGCPSGSVCCGDICEQGTLCQ